MTHNPEPDNQPEQYDGLWTPDLDEQSHDGLWTPDDEAWLRSQD
jgi:hypothetical protein